MIEHQWVHVGLDRALYGQADTAVINAIAPVTGGNRVAVILQQRDRHQAIGMALAVNPH